VKVLQINKEDTQELRVVIVSLGAVADRGVLQGPPTYITLMEDFHANWEAWERYGRNCLYSVSTVGQMREESVF
jgi:hypothetical protein